MSINNSEIGVRSPSHSIPSDDLVSIVMPMFNSASFLPAAIESVMASTYPYWELLIYDDGSSDDSFVIAGQYAEVDDRIQVYRSDKNLGAGRARNALIAKATGSYLAFLDSDDIWHPEKLIAQLSYMKKTGAEFSATGYEYLSASGQKIGVEVNPRARIRHGDIFSHCDICCSSVIVDRQLFESREFATRRLSNDYETWLNLLQDGDLEVVSYQHLLVGNRKHSRALSRHRWKKFFHHYQVLRAQRLKRSTTFLHLTRHFFYSLKKLLVLQMKRILGLSGTIRLEIPDKRD